MPSPDLAAALVASGAAVVGLFGVLHFLVTAHGNRLEPREGELKVRMQAAHLHITRQTTFWRVWIGFNHSHSLGALLFGLVWAPLALLHPEVLFGSVYLLALGAAVLLVYNLLAWKYWFSTPQRGICLATALYLAGLCVRFWPL